MFGTRISRVRVAKITTTTEAAAAAMTRLKKRKHPNEENIGQVAFNRDSKLLFAKGSVATFCVPKKI